VSGALQTPGVSKPLRYVVDVDGCLDLDQRHNEVELTRFR
jgi:hypothetical protein